MLHLLLLILPFVLGETAAPDVTSVAATSEEIGQTTSVAPDEYLTDLTKAQWLGVLVSWGAIVLAIFGLVSFLKRFGQNYSWLLPPGYEKHDDLVEHAGPTQAWGQPGPADSRPPPPAMMAPPPPATAAPALTVPVAAPPIQSTIPRSLAPPSGGATEPISHPPPSFSLAPPPSIFSLAPPAPQHAPPAISESEREVWEQFEDDEGTPYFTSTRTGKTTWERPSGPGVTIVIPEDATAPAPAPAPAPFVLRSDSPPPSYEPRADTPPPTYTAPEEDDRSPSPPPPPPPAPPVQVLPEGWERFEDDDTKEVYYYHAASGQTTWEFPEK